MLAPTLSSSSQQMSEAQTKTPLVVSDQAVWVSYQLRVGANVEAVAQR